MKIAFYLSAQRRIRLTYGQEFVSDSVGQLLAELVLFRAEVAEFSLGISILSVKANKVTVFYRYARRNSSLNKVI